MVAAYLGDHELADGVRLLEIGCGTGVIARALSGRASVRPWAWTRRRSCRLVATGTIGVELAAAVKTEARWRAAHAFFGPVAYASLTTRKPA